MASASASGVCGMLTSYSTHDTDQPRGWPKESQTLIAHASRRLLLAMLGLAALAICLAGCMGRAGSATLKGDPLLSREAISTLVNASLQASGTPEPPLSAEATRTARREYLNATEAALTSLARLPEAKQEKRPSTARLLLEDQSSRVLTISKLLAVELADSIDRSDAPRAERTLRLAVAYADSVAIRSIPDWTASGAVADTLALGIRSVEPQLDDDLAGQLSAVLESLIKSAPNEDLVLAADAKRIRSWMDSISASTESVRVESVPLMAGVDPDARTPLAAEYREALAVLAPDGMIPHEVMVAESRIAADLTAGYLNDPRGPVPSIDETRHPISALLLSILKPTITAAPDLANLRSENLRLIALTLKIAAAHQPDDLTAMGEFAISPVSGLPFEYIRRESGFDLVRPRHKVQNSR